MREIHSFAGAPGTGKTTLMKKRLADHARVIVVDPSPDGDDHWRRGGYVRVSDIDKLSRHIAARYRGSFRVVWTPPADLTAEALDRVSGLLWRYQEREAMRAPIALACDEISECYSNDHARSKSLRWYRYLLLQGRHLNIWLYGSTPRPQDVAARFRDLADHAYFFRLYDENARAAVIAKIGRENQAKYLSLKGHQCVHWNGGTVAVEGRA
jgi:hypothetical protein